MDILLIEDDLIEVMKLKRTVSKLNLKHSIVEAKNGESAPRYSKNHEVIGSIGITLDITEQKELELQKEKLVKDLENSNQGLQEYAHIVSHDLKSPLRSISALATWLCGHDP